MIQHTSAKQKILNILKKMQLCTIKELMQHFSISEISIRKHLGDLEQQGFISKKSHKQPIGRPYYTYELTDKGHQTFPNQYAKLPTVILKDIELLYGKKAIHQLSDRWMEREQDYYHQKMTAIQLDQRIKEWTELQIEKGYMIECKKDSDGSYLIRNYNCPILNIATKYPRFCDNEQKVIRHIFTQCDVKLESCLTEGTHYCQWRMKKSIGEQNNSRQQQKVKTG